MVTGYADHDVVIERCPECGSTHVITTLQMQGTGDPSNYSEVLVCKDCGHEW